jgi:hypothetical protein
VKLVDPPPSLSSPAQPLTQESSPAVPIVHPPSPSQTSHVAPHPIFDPPSPPEASPFRAPPPSPPHPLGDPLFMPPARDPPSSHPLMDPRPSKKSKFSIPKLVSPYEKKSKGICRCLESNRTPRVTPCGAFG